MSVQRLSAKSIRRIERKVGTPILRAWANGGYLMEFVTPDHHHGWWDKKTDRFGWLEKDDPELMHYTSCKEFE